MPKKPEADPGSWDISDFEVGEREVGDRAPGSEIETDLVPSKVRESNWHNDVLKTHETDVTKVGARLAQLGAKPKLTAAEKAEQKRLTERQNTFGVVGSTLQLMKSHFDTSAEYENAEAEVDKAVSGGNQALVKDTILKRSEVRKKLEKTKDDLVESHRSMIHQVPAEWRPSARLGTRSSLAAAATNPQKWVKAVAQSGFRTACQVYFVDMHDGSKAVYKPTFETALYDQDTGGTPVRRSLDSKNLESEREVATDKLDKLLGFGLVPAVEMTKGFNGKGPGHLQQWVIGDPIATKGMDRVYADDAFNDHIQIHQLAALDWLTGNTDRHLGNIMRGVDGQYHAIDNGLSWPKNGDMTEFKSKPMTELTSRGRGDIRPEVMKAIKKLDIQKVADTLKEGGFPPREMAGFLARKRVIEAVKEWPHYTIQKEGLKKWLEYNMEKLGLNFSDIQEEAENLMGDMS